MTVQPAGALGQRLRAERQRADLSLRALAEETGIAKSYLVRLENENDPRGINPSLRVLRRLAAALGVSVADLIADE